MHSKSGPVKNFKSFWIGQKIVNPSNGMLPLKIKNMLPLLVDLLSLKSFNEAQDHKSKHKTLQDL